MKGSKLSIITLDNEPTNSEIKELRERHGFTNWQLIETPLYEPDSSRIKGDCTPKRALVQSEALLIEWSVSDQFGTTDKHGVLVSREADTDLDGERLSKLFEMCETLGIGVERRQGVVYTPNMFREWGLPINDILEIEYVR